MSDSRIERLFQSDQHKRFGQKSLAKKDADRLKKLKNILGEKIKLDGKDYYMIAMIYHHQQSEYRKAREYAKMGISLGDAGCKWLYAASTDRILVLKGKPQKYGTQWQIKNGRCKLWPINPKTTDRARARYGVEPLRKIKSGIRMKNIQLQKDNSSRDNSPHKKALKAK